MRIARLLTTATASLVSMLPASSIAASPSDLSFEHASNLPREFSQYMRSDRALDPYVLTARINPFYLQGDFNGDGRSDFAIWVRESASGKVGVLICHGGKKESFVVAAGKPFEQGTDLSSYDSWYVFANGAVSQSAHTNSPPPVLVGDAIHLAVLEATSGLIYWNGSRYAWYQQGD